MFTAIRRAWPLVAVALFALALSAAGSQAANGGKGKRPADVVTKTDAAKGKLDSKLQEKIANGETQTVPIFASLTGDVAAAKALVKNAKVAQHDGYALLVGSIPVQLAPKLASLDGVISVGLVEFKQTGQPLGWRDPDFAGGHDPNPNAKALWKKNDLPYSQAPALKGSNFGALKGKGYLDAKSHNFDGAWAQGFEGQGVTASVLDGGTDWGHPDLLGTWQTWSNAPVAGWNGWPMAFDPYDTLVWLAAPQFVDQGLSWYTPTTEVKCPGGATKSGVCPVSFATRVGPSRNLAAPDAFKKNLYQFPSSYSKSGTVRMTWSPDDYLLGSYGERPAVLVTDPHTAGVYDTVYVDLDDDYDFSDEKPVTKESPAAYRDMNGDGYADISGGLLTFISDGQTLLPGGVDAFDDGSPEFADAFTFGPGEMLMWTGDYDPGIEGHGTLTASNVVGQAVVNGLAPTFTDFGQTPGAVLGGAPKAKLAPMGDIYFSFGFSTQLGYLLSTLNGIDVTSNSYGSSNVDNDGFDAASQEADFIHALFGPTTTPIFSTGNGAPGYGTTTPPTPLAGISVGASTQFGGTGWDSVAKLSQIADNDVVVWSNRGPGATGKPGVDVVADGAYSAGDKTLNAAFDGRFAWETWGGTSRSTPVTVGAAALVYQAYKASHGGAEPTSAQVKRFLKSSATDLKYDAFTQGAGSVDAGQAVQNAAGTKATVTPDQWRPGTYRAQNPAPTVFPHLLGPGQSASQPFGLAGGSGTYTASARILKRVATVSKDWTSKPVSQESASNFNAPDYLFDLSADIAAHPGADLMVVRANYPRAQFDGNADYAVDQAWRLLLYKFNDQDGDHTLWVDKDGDGIVDHCNATTSSNIDAFPDINFGCAANELDKGEYVRFMYHRPGANTLMGFVHDPEHRDADKIYLGFQHNNRNAAIPTTTFKVQVEFYKFQDWNWVTFPGGTSVAPGGSVGATMTVPAGTKPGMYQGSVVLSQAGQKSIVIPTSVAVPAIATQDATTNEITGSTVFGGSGQSTSDELYDNGSVFGANDWTWRAESGDWRFFFLDVPRTPPAGSLFLTSTTWDDPAPYTDLDTLLFGRGVNRSFQVLGCGANGCPAFGGPYILALVGGSPNTNQGAGVWGFDTATGGASDLVAGRAQEGLHEVAIHQVGFDGGKFNVPFTSTVAGASVAPSTVTSHTADGTGAFDVTFKAGIDLPGFNAEAFGLSQPELKDEVVHQDDPNDPSTASVKETVHIAHASRATFTVDVDSDDVDLFIVHDGQIIASSTGGAGADERVTLVRPEDGDYQIWLHGFAVAGTPTVKLGIDIVQGTDMTATVSPSGAIPAGTPVTIHVTYAKAGMTDGTFKGELLLGPPAAPTALSVPVTVIKP